MLAFKSSSSWGWVLLGCGLSGTVIGQEFELEEVVVVASRVEEPRPTNRTVGSSTAITAEEILAAGATNLSDVFKYEPGVSIPFDTAGVDGLVPYLGGGDSAINIRGLEGNRISINIDGIRQPEDFVAKSFDGSGGPGRIYFDPAVFSQVELSKSAASSLYGSDALGGVVSGRTESALTLLGPELEGYALRNSLTFASVNESLHNRVAHAFGNGRTAASVVYSYRRGQERQNNSYFPANPADFESHAYVATLNWRPSDDSLVTFTADHYLSDSFVDVNSSEGDTGQGIVNQFVTSEDARERLRFSLDYETKPDVPHLLFDSLKLSSYWQDATSATDNIQQGIAFGGLRDWFNDIDYRTIILGQSLEAEKSLGNHTITYGVEGSHTEVEASFFRTQNFPGGSSILQDLIGMAPSDVLRGGIYVSDRITFGDRKQLVLTPALRLDYYSVTPENTESFLALSQDTTATDYQNISLSPSLAVRYNVSDELNFFGSWSQGTRNPSAEELNGVFVHGAQSIVIPNPDLDEERSNSFEIGFQFENSIFNAQVSGYYNLYDQFFESNIATGEFTTTGQEILQTRNLAEAEIYGVEFKSDWRVGEQFDSLQGLSVGGSLAWSEGRYDDGINGDAPLNSIEPWKAVGYLSYDHPDEKWGARLTATYSAAKEDSDIDGDSSIPADSWLTLDFAASYQLGEGVTLRGGVANLLDEEYILWSNARRGNGHGSTELPNSFFTQPGRTFFVACDIAF
ncbi:MAG: TonB-dependent hemoglobin/transferrin/lactoferrin family receptor [Roseibacillus sp.]